MPGPSCVHSRSRPICFTGRGMRTAVGGPLRNEAPWATTSVPSVRFSQAWLCSLSLAAVWTTSHDEPESAVRQHLFANLVFSHFVLARSWGTFSDADLLAHAQGLLHNPVFHRYWDATRPPPGHD
ncbi:DUF6082 family protein [Streptomyces scabichelini]|uniref:DUF6082 family protein n=1 Tax=Streptomyces scabichelini TaxID=2711217 RepID=UPI003B96C4FF